MLEADQHKRTMCFEISCLGLERVVASRIWVLWYDQRYLHHAFGCRRLV